VNKSIIVIAATALLLLTGCAPQPFSDPAVSDPAVKPAPENQTGEAVKDAIGVDVTPLLLAQLTTNWNTMVDEADDGCFAGLTGQVVDPAAFNAASVSYAQAVAGMTIDQGGIPGGFPITVPIVDTGDWCAVSATLKSARG
jgi:hypothetical protein